MIHQITANIKTTIVFFKRSRLFIASAIIVIILMAMIFIPSLILGSLSGKFDIIKGIIGFLCSMAFLLSALLGLITLHSHIKSRSVKMIITKPFSAELYLLSIISAYVLVFAVVHILITLLSLALCLIWSIPVQTGMFFLLFDNFLSGLLIFSMFMFLTLFLHPVVAVLLTFIISENTFKYFILWTAAAVNKFTGFFGDFFAFLEKVFIAGFVILPAFSPFAEEKSTVISSFRISGGEVIYFFYSYAYYITLTAFFYFASVFLLKRKRLI